MTPSVQFLPTALVVAVATGAGVACLLYLAWSALKAGGALNVAAAAARDRILSPAATMRWMNRAFAGVFAALAARLATERS